MFGHQVIESLLVFKAKIERDKIDYYTINRLIGKIQKAQHFHFENAEGIKKIINLQHMDIMFYGRLGEYINPPYNTCWFEFDFKENSIFSKIGYIFYKVSKSCIACLCFTKQTKKKLWIPQRYGFVIGLGVIIEDLPIEELEEIKKSCGLGFSITRNIMAVKQLSIFRDSMFDSNPSKYKDFWSYLSVLEYLNFALMLLNCQNINTFITNPDPNLNKKRRKNKKHELFSYHTLKLVLPIEKSKKDSLNLSDYNVRLHLCRGHFKTYTKENPLFGQKSGRFWWQPQIRGNKQEGIVIKDYDVQAKT